MWIDRGWKHLVFYTTLYVLEYVHNKVVINKVLVLLKNKTTEPTAFGNSFRSIRC